MATRTIQTLTKSVLALIIEYLFFPCLNRKKRYHKFNHVSAEERYMWMAPHSGKHVPNAPPYSWRTWQHQRSTAKSQRRCLWSPFTQDDFMWESPKILLLQLAPSLNLLYLVSPRLVRSVEYRTNTAPPYHVWKGVCAGAVRFMRADPAVFSKVLFEPASPNDCILRSLSEQWRDFLDQLNRICQRLVDQVIKPFRPETETQKKRNIH